ncbi:hypothetical protein ACV1CY_12600 [Aeromonas caviae]
MSGELITTHGDQFTSSQGSIQSRAHSGYLWLNLHLIEQLAHLYRLLGLVLQPYAKPSTRP